MLELLFVGAGPHCLTTLLRLLEPDPDPTIDTPRRKTHPKAQVLKYWHRQRTDAKYRQAVCRWLQQHVSVIDPAGCWLARWEQQFHTLGIQHLRSSSAVHPDPLDTYALVTYAGTYGRINETLPLNHIHKTQDFHGPFHTPGAQLFEDFCRDLIDRYCLQGFVTRDSVVNLTPVYVGYADTCCRSSDCSLSADCSSSSSSGNSSACGGSSNTAAGGTTGNRVHHWLVDLESGRQLQAKHVIVGIGSTNRPRIPPVLEGLKCISITSTSSSSSSCSSSKQAAELLEAELSELQPTSTQQLLLQQQQTLHVPSVAASATAHQTVQLEADTLAGSFSNFGCGLPSPSTSLVSSCTAVDVNCEETCCSPRPLRSSSIGSWQMLTSCPDSPLSCSLDDTGSTGSTDSTGSFEPAPGTYPKGRLMHSWDLVAAAGQSCHTGSSRLQQLDLLQPGDHVVVIGGGLTSAHLAQMALQHSAGGSSSSSTPQATPAPPQAGAAGQLTTVADAGHVTLLMRSEWRVKQFDVNVDYMGRHRGRQLGQFRELKSFDQRLKLMREVLQGGSMPPEAEAVMQQLQQSGLLTIRQHTSLVAAEWDWLEGQWDLWLQDGSVIHAQRLWLATGSHVGVEAEPLLQGLLQQLPIPVFSGLPAIQPSLEWTPGSGLYILGAYAALSLGPGALNLAGAKTASVLLQRQLLPQLLHALPPGHSAAHTARALSTSTRDASTAGSSKASNKRSGNKGSVNVIHAAGACAAVPSCTAGQQQQQVLQGLVRNMAQPCTAPQGSSTLCLTGPGQQHQRLDCCGACWKSRAVRARSKWSRQAQH